MSQTDCYELGGVTFNHTNKFDIQLSQSLRHERRLGEIFASAKMEKIELKSETWQWEQTGNICVEYRQDGKPSGIAVTEADVWVHELRRGDQTLVYLLFPIERLKELARRQYQAGNWRTHSGDGGRFEVVLIPLSEILR